jgi:hypothetical protein
METRERIKPGYKPGATTRELASTLSFHLWELIREQANPKTLELLDLHSSMEAIACGLYLDDNLADPLGNIVKVLQFLDGVGQSEDSDDASTPEEQPA